MALTDRPLLTIAIPTYNRAEYLDRCLSFLTDQLLGQNYPIEIIISDNCSVDNTDAIIKFYKDKGFGIRHIRNQENRGADFNIAQCYLEARGKYVVAFGDDDVFLKGSIKEIVSILQSDDYGVLHLSSIEFNDETIPKVDKVSVENYGNIKDFALKVNYYITFISGNIINTRYLDKEELASGIGSFMVQVPFILNAILSSKLNGIVSVPTIATEPNNTGGYHLFKTFGPNLRKMMLSVKNPKQDELRRLIEIVSVKLLKTFFPVHILNYKQSQKSTFMNENPLKELSSTFAKYPAYWFFCFPLFRLSAKAGTLYFSLLKRIFF